MSPVHSAMLQQNNNNNYPCLNMTGPTGGEGLQACPRAPGPFPSRMELSLGDLPLVRGLRAWALCSKNRLKTRGELGGGGQAPTLRPTASATTTTTHGRLTSCTRPADMYPAGELGGMGYGLPVGLDARQAGIGALVTVATLKTSEVGGKTQTQCLFLRTEKGSCLYSTTKPGGWSLGKGPGMTAGGASALVGSWLRGKVSGGGGGGGGGAGHQAGKRTGVSPLPPPPPALQSGGSNRVRVRSGRRWRKSCNASGPGQNKTTGQGSQRRGREEAGAEVILGERQEGRDKGVLHNSLHGGKECPGARSDRARGGRKQEGGTGANRSCRCCHNTLARNCAPCARRAVGPAARHGLEDGSSPGAEEPAMNGLDTEDEGKTNGEQEKSEKEEREEENGSESLDSIVFLPNADSQTNCFYPESFSNREASEKSHDKDIREINEPLETKMSACSENKEEPCSQNTMNDGVGRTPRNPSREELNDGLGNTPVTNHLRQHSECLPPEDGSSSPPLLVRNPLQKHCEDVRPVVSESPAVADSEPQRDSRSPRDPQADEGNRLRSVGPAPETACCCEEGPRRLTAARPVEGSTSPAELCSNVIQEQQASSTAAGDHNNRHTESAERRTVAKQDSAHSEGRPQELPVKSDNRLMPGESSRGAFFTKEPFHEEKPLREAGNVKCNKSEGLSSEEHRGSCNQATLSCRTEGRAGEDETENAASAPGLRGVDGPQREPVSGAVRGIATKATEEEEEEEEKEEDKRLRDEEDCSETELKEQRGDELAEEHRRAESGSESCRVDGETVPELRGDDSSGEIRGEKTKKRNNKPSEDEGLQGGSAEATGDGDRGRPAVRRDEGEAGHGRPPPPQPERETRDASQDLNFTAEGMQLQEFAVEWTQDANCAPSGPPLPLEEEEQEEEQEQEQEEEEEGTRRRGGGQGPLENAETCCPLSVIPDIANTAPSTPLPDPLCKTHAAANPAPPPPPPSPAAMATDPQRPGASAKTGATQSRVEVRREGGERGAEEEGEEGEVHAVCDRTKETGQKEEGRLKEGRQEQSATVATERRECGEEETQKEGEEEEEEEDEFGVFMQADAEPGWSEGFAPSAPVACGNTENTGEFTQWTSGWTDDSFHQSDDSWTAFSQDSLDASGDPVAQWWPITAGEERRERLSSNQNVMEVLAEAFPASGQLTSDPHAGSGTVLTLTQLLQGERHHSRTTQDQGLLDNFHDLNKMIGQRYKRANGVSRSLLLKTLHLEPAYTEIRNISRPINQRLSPGLPSANRHTQSSKRRLSYDYNRNIAE